MKTEIYTNYVPNIVDSYTWNWIDDWDNYDIWYNEDTDSICNTMTSTSRGGSNPDLKVSYITQEMMPKAVNAWKRQASDKITKESTEDSIIPMIDKEVEVVGYSRGKNFTMNGKRGIVKWTGKQRKFHFRNTPYHQPYMDEEVAKVEIEGKIHWIPFDRLEVVNPNSYIPTKEQVMEIIEARLATRGISWIYVLDVCDWRWKI